MFRYRLINLFTLILSILVWMPVVHGETYDTVLTSGRVMDPESGLDAILHVGISDGVIMAISENELQGTRIIDASGLVLAPGFVDLHSHAQTLESNMFQAQDGVTTALELEMGVADVTSFYRKRESNAIIHYGATVGHQRTRETIIGRDDPASKEQQKQLLGLLTQGLNEGAIGVGTGIGYSPGSSREEVYRIFELVASRQAPIFIHQRENGLAGLQEIVGNAVATGARLHICHIGSSALHQVPVALDFIFGARERGVDVSVEVYPYVAGQTTIGSALFDPGWQERMGIDYKDLMWVKTGDRLTKESFDRFRADEPNSYIIIYAIPEEMMKIAVAHPDVIIATDAIALSNNRTHPRSIGTFARVLGRFAREEKSLTLMQALAKMTIQPVKRLEDYVPQMRKKGRLQVGMDADITVFNPDTVIDKATFMEPLQASEGIEYVMVNGILVVDDGKPVRDIFPGEAIRKRNIAIN